MLRENDADRKQRKQWKGPISWNWKFIGQEKDIYKYIVF